MKVALRYANASFFGKMISFWTRSKFQHAEIVFELTTDYPVCFSSSEDDGGTRFKFIEDLNDPAKWLLMPVPVNTYTEITVHKWVHENLIRNKDGKRIGYSWLDIASFVFHNIDPSQDNRWICSAVCLRVLQQCGFYKNVRCQDCSPELLYELVQSLPELQNAFCKASDT